MGNVYKAIGVIAVLLAVFICGRCSVKIEPKIEVRVDTVVFHDVKHDTLWRQKVIYRDLPVYVTDTVTNTEVVRDTVRVEVPISRYVFKDSLYYAEVDGFEVQLHRMEVYSKTITKTIVKKPWFVVSAGVGAGYDFAHNKLAPTVGVQAGIVLWSK